MNNPIIIAVDAMGGDDSPKKIIEGISMHSRKSLNIFYKIFGDSNKIDPFINIYKLPKNKFEIVAQQGSAVNVTLGKKMVFTVAFLNHACHSAARHAAHWKAMVAAHAAAMFWCCGRD